MVYWYINKVNKLETTLRSIASIQLHINTCAITILFNTMHYFFLLLKLVYFGELCRKKAATITQKKKKTGIQPHFKKHWEIMCLCAGWVPMRTEIGWNVGMHSHPECLNKLPMNEVVNTGQQKTTIPRIDTDHPERKWNQDVFVYTHVHYLERA